MKSKKKRMYLNREIHEIMMDGSNNTAVEKKISDDLSQRLGFRLPVSVTAIDPHRVKISYYFQPKDMGPRTVGDVSLPEEYVTVLINGEWKDYTAPHSVGWAPRFGGRYQIMIQPEEIERIMKANNRELHCNRIKSVTPKETKNGFEVEVVFG